MSEEQVVDQVQDEGSAAPELEKVVAPEVDEAKLETEKEARLQGWVPKDEFRGKETDWIDADIFVQRGREINPILRKNNERIQKELDKAKKDLAELRIGVEEFKQFQKESKEKLIQGYETELLTLREQKKLAISSGDGELAVQLDDQMDAIKEAKAASKESMKEDVKEAKEEKAEVNPKIEAWVEDNQWYKTSKVMSTTANAIAEEIRDANPFFTEDQFLKELDKRLEETFSPEKLGRKVKPRNPVEGASSGSSPASKGKQTYDSLPPDAKQACDTFLKQGIIKSKEEYVKEYYATV